MPPPTAVDAWLAARRFAVIIDAGSSGSRLQLYSWRDARVVKAEEGAKVFRSLPNVEKGTSDANDWISKVEPGISTFGDNPEGVGKYLAPLLEHARKHIPPSLEQETPLFLLATAGMRLLAPTKQNEIIKNACDFLKFHSHFVLDKASSQGPCGSSIRIITGEEEGLFGWIAVNYLMDGFTSQGFNRTTYGFLDMGGASTQIAFEPSEEERNISKNLKNVRLRLLGGEEIEHEVFVTTWLGYGTNQARERYVGDAISRHEELRKSSPHDPDLVDDVVHDPCLPRDLQLAEIPVHTKPTDNHSKKSHTLLGTGSFEKCLTRVAPLLNKNAPCPDTPCLFNGVHVPHIDFSVSQFIGVSEYWYSSEHVFGLGGAYDFVQFERAASDFCSKAWTEIKAIHEEAKQQGHLGGDGEVDQGGHIVGMGKWGDKIEISRLQMQCFKSAWIVNVLHEGIGMPRIVDPGGNSTSNIDNPNQKAEQKGLGRPTFQSVDVIGDTAISWTLGKMVLEASREIPPLSKDASPISDPVVNTPDIFGVNGGDHGPPGSDFEIGDREIPPPLLSRHSLRFSPLGLLLYLTCVSLIIVVAWRLRRQVATASRRFLRRALKKGDIELADPLTVEEGRFTNGSRTMPSSPQATSPTTSTFGHLLAFLHSHITRVFRSRAATAHAPQRPVVRRMHSSPHGSPTLRGSFPSGNGKYPYQNNYANGASNGSPSANGHAMLPRSETPPIYHRDQAQINGSTAQPFYSLPRSRNNSQLNLTTLITRQASSRGTSSGQQTPTGHSFHDGD